MKGAVLKTFDKIVLAKNDDVDSNVTVDFTKTKKAAMILRAVNHKLRQNIILLLEENERLTVTEIYVKLRLEQSVASQHLAILRRAGIVKTVRDGKYIFYSVDKAKLKEITGLVDQMLA
jgi:ArsR family transcriptional regulator, virulence genes transcriptional regulator